MKHTYPTCFAVLILASLSLSATLASRADHRGEIQRKPPADEPVAICHIEKRGFRITVYAGEKGPLYTVRSSEGKLLAEHIDEATFRSDYAELYHALQTDLAGDDAMVR